MAIKAALAAALLVALVSLAAATTFTTTIITNEDDNRSGQQQQQQQCRQMVQGRQFRACQRYFQQGRGPYEVEEEEVIEMSTGRSQQQQHLEECCQQLKEMDRQQCGCEAIRHAVRHAQEGGSSYQTGQSEQIYRKAQSLPRVCGLRQQQCHFRIVLV